MHQHPIHQSTSSRRKLSTGWVGIILIASIGFLLGTAPRAHAATIRGANVPIPIKLTPQGEQVKLLSQVNQCLAQVNYTLATIQRLTSAYAVQNDILAVQHSKQILQECIENIRSKVNLEPEVSTALANWGTSNEALQYNALKVFLSVSMKKSDYRRAVGKPESYYAALSEQDPRAYQLTALHFQSINILNKLWTKSIDFSNYDRKIDAIKTQLQDAFDQQNQLAETLLIDLSRGKFPDTVEPLQTIMLDMATKYQEVWEGFLTLIENYEGLADNIRAAQNTLINELVKPIPEKKCVATDSPKPPPPEPYSVYPFPTDIAQHSLYGDASAPVKIVAVMDFQCPYSRKSVSNLERLAKDFGDQVHILFHHSPLNFHRNAMPAAIAAECAGKQGQFKAYSDLLFNTPRLTEEGFLETSESLQLDAESFITCYLNKQTQQAIEKHLDVLDELGAPGTPSFFINGKRILGAKPYEHFKQTVEEALANVRASGLTGSEYYRQHVMKAQ